MESNAYERGYEAYKAGASIDDNPYRYSTEEYQEWMWGYCDALTESDN